MEAFQITISGGDITAALQGGLKELGSLDVTRETWAPLLEAMGVEIFPYLRKSGDAQLSVETAAQLVVETAVPDERHYIRRATVNICENIAEFITPNGVSVNLTDDGPQGLIVAVHFNRESAFLATMMLAGFARRVPEAYSLLAEAAAELAATRK